MKTAESFETHGLNALVRHVDRAPAPLTAPLKTDLLGTGFRYYARVGQEVFTSTSVRALARQLGRVTLNPRALPEALAFGFVLRDETVFNEVRSIPPHSTLNVDGTLTTGPAPAKRNRISDGETAAAALRGLLQDVLTELEPRFDTHAAGFTGGKDSRILAAMPKAAPDRWHWLTVSGRDDAEHRGSIETAERLHLRHHTWMEWTADFLDGDVHRVSADLADGIGAVSDHTLLRSYFERYRAETFAGSDVPLWIGTLADGLFAGSYMRTPATTIAEALAPRTAHLPQALAPALLDAFDSQKAFYHSNPFDFTPTGPEDSGYFLRLLTRGRLYICRSLACFDRFSSVQINPYLHPAMIDLAFETDAALLGSDSLRDGVLRQFGPGLDTPSAFGYRAPAYAHQVFRALSQEIVASTTLDGVVAAPLLDEMREGRFPDLNPDAAGLAGPAYRVHADAAQPGVKSLRDYEHLLVYSTFLNLIASDGVSIRQ